MKKQIVFIEYIPTIPCFKIARTLKLSKKYETILFCFSQPDLEIFSKAYDKIIVLDIKHKINLKNIIKVSKRLFSKNGRNFIKELRNIKPYLFQITGPDIFTMISMAIIKNRLKIYFAYDVWGLYNKKFSLSNPRLKEIFQRNIERISLKMAQGIIHKGPIWQLKRLGYRISPNQISFLPYCLDEWIHKPKKKNKTLNIVYAGGPIPSEECPIPFYNIIQIISSQKIHFHVYFSQEELNSDKRFVSEEKINPYFHIHKRKNVELLNKEMSFYDFGLLPSGYNTSMINPLWPKVTLGNRLFNYIEAGIPIVSNKELEFMGGIIEENKIGIMIDLEDLKNIKSIIKRQDYKELQRNIIKAQNKMKISKIIKDLEKFYEKVINLKEL